MDILINMAIENATEIRIDILMAMLRVPLSAAMRLSVGRMAILHLLEICADARAWPVGLMNKASASGAGDSRFESWAGQFACIRGSCFLTGDVF